MTALDIALEALREARDAVDNLIARTDISARIDETIARIEATQKAESQTLECVHEDITDEEWRQRMTDAHVAGHGMGQRDCESKHAELLSAARLEGWEAGVRDGWNASRECEYDTTGEAPSLEELIARGPK